MVISLTSFTDSARQRKEYYEIIGKAKTKDGKFKYKLKSTVPDNSIERRADSILKSVDILKSIVEEQSEYSDLANLLLKKARNIKSVIHVIDLKNNYGRASSRVYKNELESGDIYSAVAIHKGIPINKFNEAVLHEEIHRYTISLFDLYRDHKDLLSETDIAFVENLNKLYELYKQNPHKELDIKITGVDEFLTWGLTNNDFRKHLKTIIVEEKSLLNKLIDALIELFGNSNNPNIAKSLDSIFNTYIKAEESVSNRVIQGEITPIKNEVSKELIIINKI